jgi:hypothetical protein
VITLIVYLYVQRLSVPIQRKFLTMAKKSVKLYTDNVLEAFYDAIRNNSLDRLHIPHSDVFYVRSAVEAHYGRSFTLKHVEDAMRAEGWTEKDE